MDTTICIYVNDNTIVIVNVFLLILFCNPCLYMWLCTVFDDRQNHKLQVSPFPYLPAAVA